MRKPLVIANWKMNFLHDEMIDYVDQLVEKTKDINQVEIGIAAQDIYLKELSDKTKNTNIKVVAQNAHWEKFGSFTGETSPEALFDLGVDFVMLGHFERRQLFNETNSTVNKKVLTSLNIGLNVIVDVEEFEQVEPVLKGITKEQMEKVTLAFEPVYAIGTGNAASIEGAQGVARRIRAIIGDIYDLDTARKVRILYDGSVDTNNADDFISQKDIDGVLIGKAALNLESFLKLIEIAGKSR